MGKSENLITLARVLMPVSRGHAAAWVVAVCVVAALLFLGGIQSDGAGMREVLLSTGEARPEMVYERVRATRGGGGGGEPRQRRPTAREGGRRDGRVVGFSDLDVLVPGERGREALRSVKERDQAAAQAIESSLGAVLDMEEAKQEHVLIRRYMPKRECTAPKRERRKDSARGQRRVFGWVWAKAFVPAAERMATMKAVEDMIRNSTLIDGITLIGVVQMEVVRDDFGNPQAKLVMNETQYSYYEGVVTAARAKDVEIQIMVGEMPVLVTDLPPPSTMINPLSYFVINPSSPNFSNYLLVQSSVSLAMKYGWDGYNVDDEAYGSPRKAKFDCLMWKAFVEDWARSLQCAGLVLTADIQFMSNMDIINMTDYLSTSFVDKWVAMDTYYGALPFFFDNFDWYLHHIRNVSNFAVGMFPENPTNYEETMARVWAMGKVGIEEAWLWLMPIQNKNYPPLLAKWKCDCKGLSLGSCWDQARQEPPDCNVGQAALWKEQTGASEASEMAADERNGASVAGRILREIRIPESAPEERVEEAVGV